MKTWQWLVIAAGVLALFLFSRRGGGGGLSTLLDGSKTSFAYNEAIQGGNTGGTTSAGSSNEAKDPMAPSVPLPPVDSNPNPTAFKPPRRTKTIEPSTGPAVETRAGRGHF